MKEKRYTVTGTDIDKVKRLNEATLSYNDVKALLAEQAEVQTVDDIPLDPLRANANVDSDAKHLNQVVEGTQLSRNVPRT